MNTKIINSTLIGLVAALLFVAILVLVKILFAGSKGIGGNASDWVSSLASIGTFAVALFAYKKADNYIDKKVNEKSLDIVVTLIAETFVSYFHLLNDTCTNANYLKQTMLLIGMTEEEINCKNELQNLYKRIDNLFLKSAQIEKELLKLSLMKVRLPQKIEYNPLSNYRELEKIKEAYININNEIYTVNNQFAINCSLLQDNIDLIIETTNNISTKLKREFFTEKINYEYFLDIPKQQ